MKVAMDVFHIMLYCLGGGFVRFCVFFMGVVGVMVKCLFFVSGGYGERLS